VRRALAAAALGLTAAISARTFLRGTVADRGSTSRQLLDWDTVRRHAVLRTGEREHAGPTFDEPRLSTGYASTAAELAPLLEPVCGEVLRDLPPLRAIDRRGFIDVNLAIVRRLLEPVEQLRAGLPDSAATQVARRLLDRYVGELFGIMSRRVLGQYDPVLSLGGDGDPGGAAAVLYLVEPNIDAFQRDHGLPGDSLRRWLILHELTHAWQFEAHPWLASHVTSLMRQMLLDPLAGPGGSSLLHSREIVRRLPGTVRTQLRSVSRLQAVMSVLEGYSNFVMHDVGRRHIKESDALEAAARRRRDERSVVERLVFAITGLEMKMRQYEIGERFAAAVVSAAGIDTLNRVWSAPEALPSMDELRAPRRWLARMR
jgi:coenzyme F420 biosynthesis associated uncharacterized protein